MWMVPRVLPYTPSTYSLIELDRRWKSWKLDFSFFSNYAAPLPVCEHFIETSVLYNAESLCCTSMAMYVPAACMVQDGRSSACARLRRWLNGSCRDFWRGPHAPKCHSSWFCDPWSSSMRDIATPADPRVSLPLTVALEDFCAPKASGTGRQSKSHSATEITVLPQYRLIFIANKKAGSSVISSLLRRFFSDFPNASRREGCDGALADDRSHWCTAYKYHACTTLCLSPEALRRHVIFSFVRNPVERFYSALASAAAMRSSPEPTSYAGVEEMLRAIRAGRCNLPHGKGVRFNAHLETQTLGLSSAVLWRPQGPDRGVRNGELRLRPRGARFMVPLDYIGRIEHLREDFLELIEVAAEVTGRELLTPSARAELEEVLRALEAKGVAHAIKENRRTEEGLALESRIRNASLDAHVRNMYAQDIECFGEPSAPARRFSPSLETREPSNRRPRGSAPRRSFNTSHRYELGLKEHAVLGSLGGLLIIVACRARSRTLQRASQSDERALAEGQDASLPLSSIKLRGVRCALWCLDTFCS
jgi:hypothetical protein